ncbi:MAG TPA: T9SS type A sorting domain-containing protein [Ignavibacteria bacterium]|nr:T9SS type A sorting domain-containing protein [Ignavibacteria bacterium]
MKKQLYFVFLALSVLSFTSGSFSQFTDFQSPFTGSLNSGDIATTPFGQQVNSHAWLCGDSSMIMKLYFYSIPPVFRVVKGNIPPGITFNAACSIDSSTALMGGTAGGSSVVYKTTNGGQNWTQVFTQPNGSIIGIWFKTAVTGVMVGNPAGGRWSIFKTTNGGVNWDSAGHYLPQANSESSFSNDMFARGDTLWLGTNNSRIYVSTNFGMNWSPRTFGSGIQNIRAVNNDFNSNVGFIGGDSLLNTYSWGNTWNVEQNIQGTGPITSIVASNPGVDASSGPAFYSKQNKLYYSFGWSLFYTASSGNFTYLFKNRPFTQYNYHFAPMLGLLSGGRVWICICAWGGINAVNNVIPSEFILHQNYPNPFNPVTKIRFEIPPGESNNVVKLEVYDSKGELLQILMNETLGAGIYEKEFDGSSFSSGVYFYKVTSGSISVSKKMLLVK